jgi:hypothetical protein
MFATECSSADYYEQNGSDVWCSVWNCDLNLCLSELLTSELQIFSCKPLDEGDLHDANSLNASDAPKFSYWRSCKSGFCNAVYGTTGGALSGSNPRVFLKEN